MLISTLAGVLIVILGTQHTYFALLMLQAATGNKRGGSAQAYIKISEAEIADDYPVPKMYEKVGWSACTLTDCKRT